MENNRSADLIHQLIAQVRSQSRRYSPSFDGLPSIKDELRERRKHLLGSYISLEDLVGTGSSISEAAVEELSHYLASRTAYFWNNEDTEKETFCFRFYVLSIYAIASGKVGGESIDDILQMAACLVRSRMIFVDVLKRLLPMNMIAELFDFTENYPDSFYSLLFEDAVLGALAVLLGSLEDPLAGPEAAQGEKGA